MLGKIRDDYCMTKFGIIGLLSVLIVTGCGDDTEKLKEESDRHILQSEVYLEQGQYRAASIEARNAIQKAPQELKPHLMLAGLFLRLGQNDLAIEQLNQVDSNHENNPEYILLLAEANYLKGKLQTALNLIESNEKVLVGHEEDKYLQLAKIQLRNRKFELASSSLDKVLNLNDSNIEARIIQARIYAIQNNTNALGTALANLEELAPSDPDFLRLKASISYSAEDYESAQNFLSDALLSLPSSDTMTPAKANIISMLANILTLQGKSTEALIYTKMLSEAFPGAELASGDYQEALKLFQEKQYENAKAKLENLVERYPGFTKGKQLLATVHYILGEYDESNRLFAESVDPELVSGTVVNLYALSQLRLGQPNDVMELLESQIETDPSAEALSLYGLAALSAGDFRRGEQSLLKALELDPTRVRLNLALAKFYISEREPNKGLKQLQNAYKAQPDNPYVQFSLYFTLERLNKTTEAKSLLQEIEHKYSDNVESLLVIADINRIKKSYDKAHGFYSKAHDLEENQKTIRALANSFLYKKGWSEAKNLFERLIELNPEDALAYKGLLQLPGNNDNAQVAKNFSTYLSNDGNNVPELVVAEYLLGKGDLQASKIYIDQAVTEKADEKSNRAQGLWFYSKSLSELNNKNFTASRIEAVNALSIFPDNLGVKALLIDIEIADNNFDEAMRLSNSLKVENEQLGLEKIGDIEVAKNDFVAARSGYQRSWSIKPSDRLGGKLYSTLVSVKDEQAQSDHLNEWLDLFPESRKARSATASYRILKGDYKAAIPLLEGLLVEQPKDIVAMNNLAWSYMQSGNEKAIELAERAYNAMPENPMIIDTYAWVIFQFGDADTSRELLEKALLLDPDNAEIKSHLEQVRQKLGS